MELNELPYIPDSAFDYAMEMYLQKILAKIQNSGLSVFEIALTTRVRPRIVKKVCQGRPVRFDHFFRIFFLLHDLERKKAKH